MTDGLNNVLGTKRISRNFAGRDYLFSVIVLAEHAEKESYICSLRQNPLEGLLRAFENLPEDMKSNAKALNRIREKLEDKCLQALAAPKFVTRQLEEQFDDSLHGLAWSIWRALRDNESDFGKPTGAADEQLVYISEAGNSYTMKPDKGVQLTLEFMEQVVGEDRFKELFQIRDGVENPPELKN